MKFGNLLITQSSAEPGLHQSLIDPACDPVGHAVLHATRIEFRVVRGCAPALP